MNTLEAYQEEIEPTLQKLETIRLQELEKVKQLHPYYLIPVVLAIVAIPVYWKVNPIMAFVLVAIAIAIGSQIATNVVRKPAEHYITNFKKQVFTAFAKTFFRKVSYQVEKSVSPKLFLNSELFAQVPTDYKGKDYFKGETKEGCKFQFSEITATKDTKVLFEGLFFELQMPTNFQSKVIILPSKGKRSAKKVNSLEQLSLKGLTADGALIAVANVYPKFEKDFTVYSHSKEMAYYILVPPIIEAIQAISKEWNQKPKISFINNKVYIAIKTKPNAYIPSFQVSLLENPNLIHLLNKLSNAFSVLNHLSIATAANDKKDNTIENDDFPSETQLDEN